MAEDSGEPTTTAAVESSTTANMRAGRNFLIRSPSGVRVITDNFSMKYTIRGHSLHPDQHDLDCSNWLCPTSFITVEVCRFTLLQEEWMILGLILLTFVQGSLDEYHLTISQEYLDELMEDPHSGRWFPASISCSSGESDCIVKVRGNTSPEFPKKSLAINLDDQSILGRTRLNLNAQYRDLSQMRNGLGMLTTRLLGYPAPLTRHSVLYVNGEYWGVYLDIERIDTDFLQRNDYSDGPLFKATDHAARFAWLPTGIGQTSGYRPMSDSDIHLPELRRLIDAVLTGGSPEVDIGMFLAYYAVVIGIVDNDGGSMNFYIHRGADGRWSIFPWDRDSSFGSEWGGCYNPELAWCTSLLHLQRTSLYCQLLQNDQYRSEFDRNLLDISRLMSDELLAAVDSIYLEIREDVYRDSMKQGTNEEFDLAYHELRDFLINRAEFIGDEMIGLYEPVAVCSIVIDPVHLSPDDDTVHIRAWTDGRALECWPFATMDREDLWEVHLDEVIGSSGTEWSGSFPVQENAYAVYFAFRTRSPVTEGREQPPYFHFFPDYGYMIYGHDYWLNTHPAAVRVEAPFGTDELELGNPIHYGPDLWTMPLINGGTDPLDLSLCVLEFGEPVGRISLAEHTIIPPGDTLLLTNDFQSAQVQWPWKVVAGNCSARTISGSTLHVLDPGWKEVLQLTVPDADTAVLAPPDLLISELWHSGGGAFLSGDWIELYNPSLEMIDVGGFVLGDQDGNRSMIPWNGAHMEPDGFLVICRDIDRFRLVYPWVENVVEGLGFGLSNDGDIIMLDDRSGTRFHTLAYEVQPPWPESRDKVLSLLSPWLPHGEPSSWQAADPPGTPGQRNPEWFAFGSWLSITVLWPNPSSGSLEFEYEAMDPPVEGFVFDLSGRLIESFGELPPDGDRVVWDAGESHLPPGVYFLVLRSCGRMASRRFVRLR